MTSPRLKLEDYPAVADFMTISFERDLGDFTSKYKTVDAQYLKGFKASNTAVKGAHSGIAAKERQKQSTSNLYAAANKVKANVILLKDYALRGGLNGSIVGEAVEALGRRNIEAGVKIIRDALPYYTEHIEALADMPDGFLEKMATDIVHLETLNAEQNKLMNERKQSTVDNRQLYNVLYNYIADVSRMGKIIYKGTPKQDEYTIIKILQRVRAAKQSKTEAPQPEAQTGHAME